MNRLKFTSEAAGLFIHLFTGVFIGYLISINGTQFEVTISIVVSTISMFLLWGIARLQGKYLFYEIESTRHGAIAGVILAASPTAINAITGNILFNPVVHWFVGTGSGCLIGIIYGKFGEVRARKKRAKVNGW